MSPDALSRPFVWPIVVLVSPASMGPVANFLVRPDQKVLPVLVLGQKGATRFCPTRPVLVWPGLAVAVNGYPWVIRM